MNIQSNSWWAQISASWQSYMMMAAARWWNRSTRFRPGHLLGNIWWRQEMETFSALLALCSGNSPVTDEFSSQRPMMRSFDVFCLIYAWTNGWVNNLDAGDLRRHRGDYDVTVMRIPGFRPVSFIGHVLVTLVSVHRSIVSGREGAKRKDELGVGTHQIIKSITWKGPSKRTYSLTTVRFNSCLVYAKFQNDRATGSYFLQALIMLYKCGKIYRRVSMGNQTTSKLWDISTTMP